MGFCLVFPFKLSSLCLKQYGQKCPLNLCRSLCQIFSNESVLIIFPINPRETGRESFFPSAGGVTTMPTSNLLSTSDWRFRASLPVFLFFPSMFDAGSSLWSRKGCVLSQTQAQGPAQQSMHRCAQRSSRGCTEREQQGD